MENNDELPQGTTNQNEHLQTPARALTAKAGQPPQTHCPPEAKTTGEMRYALRGEEDTNGIENLLHAENPTATDFGAAADIRIPSQEPIQAIEFVPDPGAPLAPDATEVMASMKVNDCGVSAAFQLQIKKTSYQEAAAPFGGENADVPRRNPTQADILLDLAQSAELFHTPDGAGFADLNINGHRESWPIRSKRFRYWLARIFYNATEGAPNSETMQSALNVIEAKAHFDGPERAVHIRVAGLNGRIYLDLCDKTWRAVEIDDTGWRVIDRPPVRFRRAPGMLLLPTPERGGSVNALRPFLNVTSKADFVLVVAWVLAALRNRGPYPVLIMSGEQGAAKSTLVAVLRALVDPNTAALRALPREERDLFIAASNAHLIAFDNLSGLPAWVSDALCRLATGGGFATRQLRTDQDETLLTATRPAILNGIEDIVTRPDLADRSVFLAMEPIAQEQRRAEAEFWASFEVERPRILGVLLDAMAQGLKRLPETRLDKLPRMADFALWVTACETALWPAGTFCQAYAANLATAVEDVIDADLVASAVRDLMARQPAWAGTATELLGALKAIAGEHYVKSKSQPENARALSGRLRRAATFLRKIGIDITFGKEGRSRTRTIHIVKRS